MNPVNPTDLGNAMLVWLAYTAALFAIIQMPLEGFVKPFILHPLREKVQPVNDYYETFSRVAIFVLATGMAWTARYNLDIWLNVFGLDSAHPMAGAMVSVLAVTFFGKQIHDKFGAGSDE